MGRWIYHSLAERVLVETERRLVELMNTSPSSDRVECSLVTYAFELVDSETVDYRDERTLSDLLAELTSGFFMRREQFSLLDEIDTGQDTGTVRQMAMGSGKTSFIVPRLVFDECLFPRGATNPDITSPIKIIVPSYLVKQSENVINSALAVLGFVGVDVLDFGSSSRTVEDDANNFVFSSSSSGEFLGPVADTLDDVSRPARCDITIISDKTLQQIFLTCLKMDEAELGGKEEWDEEEEDIPRPEMFDDPSDFATIMIAEQGLHHPRKRYWLREFMKKWRDSTIVCDEVDLVVDPLSCQMNVSLEDSSVTPKSLIDMLFLIDSEAKMRRTTSQPFPKDSFSSTSDGG
jgi:hypothetical protein